MQHLDFWQVGVAWYLLYDTFNILRSRTIQDLLNVNRFNSIPFHSTKRKLNCSFYIFVTETLNFQISFYSRSLLLAIPIHFGDKLSDGTIRIINKFYFSKILRALYPPPTTIDPHRSEGSVGRYYTNYLVLNCG